MRPTSLGSIGRYGHGPAEFVDRDAGLCRVALHPGEALVDGVLVGAGEGGVDQVAAVGVAFGDRQLVAVLDGATDVVDVGEVDLRVHALAEQVQAQGHQAHVSCPLAIAEQAALDAVGTGQVAQFGGGHGSAAVVVRVQREHDRVPVGQVAVHPLDGVGVDVRGGHLDGGGQVDDDLVIGRRLPHVVDGVADLDGEVEFGAGVGLRRVLEVHVGAGHGLDQLLADPRALDGDVLDAVAVQPEHHATLQRGRRVVEVHDGLLRTLDGLEGAADQFLAGLGQHLDGDVVRDRVGLDELTDEVEVGLARGREADLDLLVAHPDQEVEHPLLAGRAHRVDEGLVAVTQVDGAPARRCRDDLVRPGPVAQADGRECGIAMGRHAAGLLGVVHRRAPCQFVVGATGEAQCGNPRRGSRPLQGLAAATKEEASLMHMAIVSHRARLA